MNKESNICKNIISVLLTMLILALAAGTASAYPSPAAVELGTVGNYVIFADTAIANPNANVLITGDIGTGPGVTSTAITGFALILPAGGAFSTSSQVIGNVYAFDYAPPTPTTVNTAANDMLTAYNTAAGRAPDATELMAGDISGLNLAPGVYKWSNNVLINTDVTLTGSPSDVWIFEISGDLNIASGASVPAGIKVILAGGAQASNVFWQVGGPTGATLGTYSTFNGNILSAKQIIIQTGAVLNGRALAQTQVTLNANVITVPIPAIPAPTLGKGFSPFIINESSPYNVSTLTITLSNPSDSDATLTAPFIDILPTNLSTNLTNNVTYNLTIATTPNASTTCGGTAMVNATAGGRNVTLSNGSTIPAAIGIVPGTCTVTVNVTAVHNGTYINTLPANALQTDHGNNIAPAIATLTVVPPNGPPMLGKGFSPFTIIEGGISTLTITLSNPNINVANLTAPFIDTLPAGVKIAPTPNNSTTCGGNVSATAGGTNVTLSNGSTIPARIGDIAGICTVTVNVTAPLGGIFINILPANILRTSNGNNTLPAIATLTVPIVPITINITSPTNNSVNRTGYVNVTVTLNKNGTAKLKWMGINESMLSAGTNKSFYLNKTGLLSGNYTFKVYASNVSSGLSSVSETRTITVNRSITNNLSIYIDPVTGKVNQTVNYPAPSGNAIITILNGTNATLNGSTITNITIDSLNSVKNLSGNDRLIGESISLGPEGAIFSPGVQIRINYTNESLTAADIKASVLKVKIFNTSNNSWDVTNYTTNETDRYIVVENVSKFGTLALTGTASTSRAAVNLRTAGDFVILSKSGISTTGTTKIIGDIGVSPIDSTAITGFALSPDASNNFSTSSKVTGKVYASDHANATPAKMTTAVSNMQTAYTDAAGRTLPDHTELGAGNIGGMTLTPGLYKWSSGVTIPTDVTLSGSSTDVWIFQIDGTLGISSGKKVLLSGGAQAKNIFWQVAGATTLGTTSVFNGNILDQTAIVLNTGATLNGRALAQTAVTLDANAVNFPSETIAPGPTYVPSSSGSSSGGSGVVSSEPYANIAKFESHDKSLSANVPVRYTFNVPELGIYEIDVTGKESENDITLRVELLKGTSKLVKVQAPGIVYKNINAWIGTKRMESGLIRFRVENSWLASNGFAASEIKMVRWDGSKWNILETTVLRSDSTYTYFEAKSFAFSSFAITGIKAEATASPTQAGAPAGTPVSGTSVATPRPVATPGTEAPPTTLYIIGAIILIGIIAVLVIKRKEIFK